MAKLTPEQQLARLEAKKAELRSEERRIKAGMKKQKRKDDEHEKYLIGGAMLLLASKDPEFDETLKRLLDRGVTRKYDRDFLQGRGTMLPESTHAGASSSFPNSATVAAE